MKRNAHVIVKSRNGCGTQVWLDLVANKKDADCISVSGTFLLGLTCRQLPSGSWERGLWAVLIFHRRGLGNRTSLHDGPLSHTAYEQRGLLNFSLLLIVSLLND